MILGLTGGMGCGKSTVAGLLTQQGWLRSDSDQVIREKLLPSKSSVEAIVDHFGPEALGPDGQVDRAWMARRVFTDDAERVWLEKLLHPMLYDHWRQTFHREQDEKWVVEVPLLFEKDLENWFDFTVCVSSQSSLQLARLAQRGIPTELAKLRIAKQLPITRKMERADFVIANDGSLEFLSDQVNLLITALASV
ncbi:MAG TPA: dephospho-CoA kinase [Opitutaceae bacterium]|nr:dephospho-CoA kinase [Opitutaceae bacterium]